MMPVNFSSALLRNLAVLSRRRAYALLLGLLTRFRQFSDFIVNLAAAQISYRSLVAMLLSRVDGGLDSLCCFHASGGINRANNLLSRLNRFLGRCHFFLPNSFTS